MPSFVSVLEPTIEAEMERAQITGLAIAIVDRTEVAWAKGYGVRDIETREAVTPETLCGIMSVTKPIVGTAVLQLRDAGKFDLDDPVNCYLAPVSIKNEWEAEAPVTIRQLLTHTGGLPVGIGQDPPGRHPLDEYVDLAAKTSWRPGSAIVYANWGYAALGLLVERCSGKTVGEYLQEDIFAPLSMNATVYGPPAGAHAAGHFVSRLDGSVHMQPMDEWPVIPTSPAGGCWSTVLDLTTFLRAHLNGGAGILAPETVREFHQLHARQGDSESGMGLGFRVTRSNGRKLVCHGGDGGGFTAFGGLYPDDGVGVALLINTGGMQTARAVIANEALRLFSGQPERRSFSSRGLSAGVYRSTFWDTEIEARDDGSPTLTTTEGLIVAEPPTASRLMASGDNTFEANGGMFHGFEMTIEDEDRPDGPRIYGGLYPFTFVRTGDLREPEPLDEATDLVGAWQGAVQTPMGALAVTLDVRSETEGTIGTPFGQGVTPEDFSARAGRVGGEFEMSVPGVGEFRNFLRLEARGGRLVGKTYARSNFGENAMRTELMRA